MDHPPWYNNDNPKTNGEVDYIRKLPPNRIVFDIGTKDNSEFVDYPGEVHYFDPVPKFIDKLATHTTQNTRSVYNRFGLSNENGELLYYPRYEAFYNRTVSCHIDDSSHAVKLQVRKASDYIVEKNIESIEFIKIDTEGHELCVLQGFGEHLSKVKYVQFEYGGTYIDTKTKLIDVVTHLRSYGFSTFAYLHSNDTTIPITDFTDHYQYCNIIAKREELKIQPHSSEQGSMSQQPENEVVTPPSTENKTRPIRVVFCMPGRTYDRTFLLAWSQLLMSCAKRGIEIVISQNYSSVVHFARAKCLGGDARKGPSQKPFQGELDYDYIMWIDSDIVFNDEDFFKLLESPHDVTCGRYMMDDMQHFAAVRIWDTEYYRQNGAFKFLKEDDIQQYKTSSRSRYMPIAYAGMGWMVIRRGIVEHLQYPWFYRPLEQIGADIRDMSSEDVAFCKNLQEIGIPIMLDTDIRVGHLKPIAL
jgi:FkbM family methyltransferase